MFGLTGFKLGGVIAGLLGIIAAITWLVATVRDRDHLKALDDGHRACIASVAGTTRSSPVLATCERPIIDAVAARDAALACDEALGSPLPTAAYQVRMTCSSNVKVLQADTATLAANAADLTAQLAHARDDLAGAVARGEARTATATTRTNHAQDAIARAPVGADGLIRCAGDCLRALAGDAPGVAVRR